MSRWIEEFEQLHFVRQWSLIEDMLQNIDKSVLSHKPVALEYARLKKVKRFIDLTLQGIDPELSNLQVLSDASPHLDIFINNISNFILNKDIAELQNANHELSCIMHYIGQLVITSSSNVERSLTSAAKAYAEAINEQTDQHNLLYEKLRKELLDLQTKISDQQKDQESKQNAYETRYAEANDKLDEFVQGFDIKFADTEAKRTERFNVELEEYSERAKQSLDEMDSAKDDAQKILGVIIDATQAGSYKKQANEDKGSANRLRFVSICLMVFASILLAAPLAFSLVSSHFYDFSWKELLNRATVSSAFFITAFYCARESTKHRTNEQRNRRRELTLVSAGPYFALLNDNDEKESLKLKIANHLFIDETVSRYDNETENN